MNHVMIDLETLGINPGAPILSVGAVLFDPDTSAIGGEFYRKVKWVNDQLDRQIDRSTIEFWLKQESAAQRELLDSPESITLARTLHELDQFIPKYSKVWSNGATFDVVILEDAYRNHCNRDAPWSFRNIRDCRTIRELADPFVNFQEFHMEGTAHNALDDAKFQVEWTSAAWQALRRTGA